MADATVKPWVSSAWRPSGAWDVVAPQAGRFGAVNEVATVPPGVSLEPLDPVDLVTIIAREGRQERFREIVAERFAVALPETGRAVFADTGTWVWTAPGQWLVAATASGDLGTLRDDLGETASVTDQGDGRALVRIAGPAAGRALAKCLAIDLHPDVFGAGSAATTVMAHVGVQLWREDDAPTFLLAAPRTMAGDVWRRLTAAAAEFGYLVRR